MSMTEYTQMQDRAIDALFRKINRVPKGFTEAQIRRALPRLRVVMVAQALLTVGFIGFDALMVYVRSFS